ncbi:MAG TPA: VOC family protein [Acidimicrobiales bacterium]|jgi:predicted enzyme related to lactoylglutathione lyase
MSSPVTWFEITSAGADRLHAFYADLFGWSIQPIEGMGYGVVEAAEGGIGGGLASGEGAGGTVVYVQVDDPQAYLDRVEQAGGKTVVPVTVIPDMVTFAQFADPEGNVVGLVQA